MRSLLFVCGALSAALVPVPDNDPADDIARAQGKWAVVFMQENGKELSTDEAKVITVSIEKDRVTWSAGEEVFAKYRFAFDAAKKPKQADFIGLTEDNFGKVMPAIYAFEG